jgi:hypothetical protein
MGISESSSMSIKELRVAPMLRVTEYGLKISLDGLRNLVLRTIVAALLRVDSQPLLIPSTAVGSASVNTTSVTSIEHQPKGFDTFQLVFCIEFRSVFGDQ